MVEAKIEVTEGSMQIIGSVTVIGGKTTQAVSEKAVAGQFVAVTKQMTTTTTTVTSSSFSWVSLAEVEVFTLPSEKKTPVGPGKLRNKTFPFITLHGKIMIV